VVIHDYVERVAIDDCVMPALAYLYILLTRYPDLREVTPARITCICDILVNAWTLNSSKDFSDSLENELMPFYIMKCCDLLYSCETDDHRAMLVGTKRRPLLLDFNWKKKYVREYTMYPEFWLKLISLNIQLYVNDTTLLNWAIRNQLLHLQHHGIHDRSASRSSLDNDMADRNIVPVTDGMFDIATLALTGGSSHDSDPDTPTSTTKKAANESALREVCRWKIYAGDDVVKLNQFCKKASLKFHLKSPLVHTVLLSLEDCFLWHDIGEPAVSRTAMDKRTCLQLVFPYLTAGEGLSLTLACREFRVAYRLPHLKSVLQFCSLPSSVRLSIWMQFVGGVAVS
jgi:hypothetical protein